MSRSKLIWQCSGGALLALFAVGIVAPYARADRYAERIRLGLDKALGRRVEFGDARFNLFTGPGFAVHSGRRMACPFYRRACANGPAGAWLREHRVRGPLETGRFRRRQS